MIACIIFVFGALAEYGGVLLLLKITATQKHQCYFTEKCLYSFMPMTNIASGIVALNGKEFAQDDITQKLKVRTEHIIIIILLESC